MQSSKTFLGFKLTSLLSLLLVVSSLSGCSGCGGGASKKENLDQPDQKNPRAIILFHGLNDKGNLKNLEDKLAKDFPDAKVVALDRVNSAIAPITQQAQEAFAELEKQDLLGKDLVLFGNSQGGLLAFSLYDQYQTQLNVKGIITDCTPWEGAPVANATQNSIRPLALAIAQAITAQANVLPVSVQPLVSGLDANALTFIIAPLLRGILKDFTTGSGSIDLKPGSQFLKDVAAKLPTSQVPILALAGTDVDLNAAISALISQKGNTGGNSILTSLVPLIQNKTINLDDVKDPWGKLINDNKSSYNAHDFIVPLYSAHAQNTTKPVSFQPSPVVPGYHHFMSLAQVPQVYDIVVTTIKQYLGPTDTGSKQGATGKGKGQTKKKNK